MTDPTASFGGVRFPVTPEILFGAPREPKGYDLIEGIILYIGREPNISEEECTPEEWENWKKYEESIEMLQVLFSEELTGEEKTRILEKDFNLPMTKSYSESVKTMNEYVRDVGIRKYEEGVKAGVQKGEKVGIQKGIGINQKDVAKWMYSHDFDPETTSDCSGADLNTVQKWFEEFNLKN